MTEDKFQRTEKIWRLVTLWSERDLAHLPAMQRVAQEQEMENVYEAFDEKGLDTALAIMEYKAPAKVESSGEETPSDPAKRGEIVLQTRRRLSMREAGSRCNSIAIEQLIGMKAPQLPEATQSRAAAQLLNMTAQYDRAAEKNADISRYRYLAWLPDDHPLPTAEPLGELLFRLTQPTREVEHLHGMHGQEPAPWLLLCRDSDLLNTDGSTELPTGYDKVYMDLMQTYRNAARTAMSVADTAGSSLTKGEYFLDANPFCCVCG